MMRYSQYRTGGWTTGEKAWLFETSTLNGLFLRTDSVAVGMAHIVPT
jgi:hypothetical protein